MQKNNKVSNKQNIFYGLQYIETWVCIWKSHKCKRQMPKKTKKWNFKKQNIFMDYKSQNFGFAFEIPQMQMPKVKSKIYTHKL